MLVLRLSISQCAPKQLFRRFKHSKLAVRDFRQNGSIIFFDVASYFSISSNFLSNQMLSRIRIHPAIGNDSDDVNMLSIGANEDWFHVVSICSGPETRSHRADHMRESPYIKHFQNYTASAWLWSLFCFSKRFILNLGGNLDCCCQMRLKRARWLWPEQI